MTTIDVGDADLIAAARALDDCAHLLDDAAEATFPVARRLGLAVAFSSKLDQFFASMTVLPAGPTERVRELVARHDELVHAALLPTLGRQGVPVVHPDELAQRDSDGLRVLFERQIHPVLTPLTVDATHPFPYVSSLPLNLAVSLRDRDTHRNRFTRIEVPAYLPRMLVLGSGLLPLEDVITAHLDAVFPGMQVLAARCFRVTRGPADLVVDGRSYAPATRLEVDADMNARHVQLITSELGLVSSDVYRLSSPLVMGTALRSIAELDLPSRRDAPSGDQRGAA